MNKIITVVILVLIVISIGCVSNEDGTTNTVKKTPTPTQPSFKTCSNCDGTGEIVETCYNCGGSGRITSSVTCSNCRGTGKVTKSSEEDLKYKRTSLEYKWVDLDDSWLSSNYGILKSINIENIDDVGGTFSVKFSAVYHTVTNERVDLKDITIHHYVGPGQIVEFKAELDVPEKYHDNEDMSKRTVVFSSTSAPTKIVDVLISCPSCSGSGSVEKVEYCTICQGTGEISKECSVCRGTGKVSNT